MPKLRQENKYLKSLRCRNCELCGCEIWYRLSQVNRERRGKVQRRFCSNSCCGNKRRLLNKAGLIEHEIGVCQPNADHAISKTGAQPGARRAVKDGTEGGKKILTGESPRQVEVFVAYMNCGSNYKRTAHFTGINEATLREWSYKWNWDKKLIEVDEAAKQMIADDIVGGRASRLKKQLELGVLMLDKASEYFVECGVESGQVAISAAKGGAEMVRTVDPIPDILLALSTASPEELIALRQRLMDDIRVERQ